MEEDQSGTLVRVSPLFFERLRDERVTTDEKTGSG